VNARDLRMLAMALEMAATDRFADFRDFRIAAVGVRNDGAIVSSANGAVKETGVLRYRAFPKAHAEARLSRKLDVGATVYVARASKTGAATMAKPCPTCKRFLKARGCRRVVFTTYDGVGEELL
jgi:tRNA(Arg) A34 adenosine deaminase TadA